MPLTFEVADRSITVEGVLFDKDGTLIDLQAPWGTWGEHVIATLAAGGPERSTAALRAAIGVSDGYVEADGVLAGGTAELVVSTLADVLDELEDGDHREEVERAIAGADAAVDTEDAIRALQGAGELIAACEGATNAVGVVTADTTARARRHLEMVGLAGWVRSIVGADRVARGKPDPAAVVLACEELGVRPARTVFFGDSEHDALAAERAGVPICVLVRATPPPGSSPRVLWVRSWDEVRVTSAARTTVHQGDDLP